MYTERASIYLLSVALYPCGAAFLYVANFLTAANSLTGLA